MNVVLTLLEAGLTLGSDGERLLVAPRAGITPGLRCLISENKPTLLAYVRQVERTASDLVDAINRCCDLRGDDETNRAGLIHECLSLSTDAQADMAEHFTSQANVWAKASGTSGGAS